MKYTRKILAFVMVFILITFVACTEKEAPSSGDSSQSSSEIPVLSEISPSSSTPPPTFPKSSVASSELPSSNQSEASPSQSSVPQTAKQSNETGEQTVDVRPEDRIIMVHDRLYYGTNEVGPMGDADAIGGEILSSVSANEIPNENGQSNFGEIGAYYTKDNSDESFIMVNINEEWFVFNPNEVTQHSQPANSTSVSIVCAYNYGKEAEKTFTDTETVDTIKAYFQNLTESAIETTPKTGGVVFTITITDNGSTTSYRFNSPQRDGTLYCKNIAATDWTAMTGWLQVADAGAYDYVESLFSEYFEYLG